MAFHIVRTPWLQYWPNDISISIMGIPTNANMMRYGTKKAPCMWMNEVSKIIMIIIKILHRLRMQKFNFDITVKQSNNSIASKFHCIHNQVYDKILRTRRNKWLIYTWKFVYLIQWPSWVKSKHWENVYKFKSKDEESE